ncbi:hypothetical protein IFM89_028115 [Coptis chinensis]|uniref:F-box associated beta-propeller type 3 domain-containing protein n=1 Tax=Coptis chinensis TaxID=261450 RepID=A0A835HXS0_9MAGN|nr:hypothetical protein IFM89_028115 [Coptis chinensis]
MYCCMTRGLLSKLIGLFVPRSTKDSRTPDDSLSNEISPSPLEASYLHDNSSLLDNRSVHVDSLSFDTCLSNDNSPLLEATLHDNNSLLDNRSVHVDCPSSDQSPPQDSLHSEASHFLADKALLDGPLSDYIPFLEDKTCDDSKLLLLPDDIIIDILSRLTVECALQCRPVCRPICQLMSTPIFIAMQCSRSTPVLVVQFHSLSSITRDEETGIYAANIVLHFVDEGERIVAASTKFQLSYKPKYDDKPILIGSYNGFLLFRHFLNGAFLIFNPTTQEQVLLTGEFCLEGCALYYHTPTNELKFLYKKLLSNRFFILGLKSKLKREISSREVPCTCDQSRAPVVLYGRMHWMAAVDCDLCIDDPPTCSKSILVFKMDSEDFITMPHPEGKGSCSKERHKKMQLLEMEGQLCLCETSLSTWEVYLWVLDDYTNQVWIKRYTISIESLNENYYYHDSHCFPFVQVLQIRNDELLLKSDSRVLHYYHLKLNIFRKVGVVEGFEDFWLTSVVAHTNTLASLQTDSVISL